MGLKTAITGLIAAVPFAVAAQAEETEKNIPLGIMLTGGESAYQSYADPEAGVWRTANFRDYPKGKKDVVVLTTIVKGKTQPETKIIEKVDLDARGVKIVEQFCATGFIPPDL